MRFSCHFYADKSRTLSIMKTKLLLGNILLFAFLLFVIELGLRLTNHQPGNLTPNWANFKPVDSLIEYHHFYTDSNGLIVANKSYFDTVHININTDGFRTPEWSSIDTSKKTDLFIGDSFTWGLSANPITACFVDLVRNQSSNNTVNLGIPVADPLQYALLAKQYIPKFKPQHVFVMLYLGNDIMQNDRSIAPYKPLYFYTNAGAMLASDNNRTFTTASEAYHYYVAEKYFLIHPKTIVQTIAAKSALLTQLYAIHLRWNEKQRFDKSIEEMTYTKKYLYQIAEYCETKHSQLYIVIIPERKEADEDATSIKSRYKALFADPRLNPYVVLPSGINNAYYTPYPDAHLNNAGHQFYAKQILGLLNDSKK
jgi:hypothetical protein